MINEYKNTQFKELLDHFSEIHNIDFGEVIGRRENVNEYTIDSEFIRLDFNRNRANSKTLKFLENFLESNKFDTFKQRLFSGEKINLGENRSADHIALRNTDSELFRGSESIRNEIKNALNLIRVFTETIHSGRSTDYLAGNLKHIVHIGIGGSDLGPRMIVDGLEEFKSPKAPEVYFISSVDPYQVNRVLEKIELEKTLFIIVSKSFKTPEIQILAQNFIDLLKSEKIDYKKHLLLISSNKKAYEIMNTEPQNMINFPETIGGRFSLWSATGLSISIYLGYERFLELLAGASQMDRHFLEKPPLKNMPVLLALLEFWYTNFFKSGFSTVNPYTERLALLPMYLQQLEMESNGKTTNLENNNIDYPTVTPVLGVTGTACQHSYFQALHQGKHFFHADFIGLAQAPEHSQNQKNYDFLYTSMLAQAHTLIHGYKTTGKEVVPQNKIIEGNKPCNLIILKKWNPAALGNLIAMYEHKTVTLGNLWQINSFDQPGVERGKVICSELESLLQNKDLASSDIMDPVTVNDLNFYKESG